MEKPKVDGRKLAWKKPRHKYEFNSAAGRSICVKCGQPWSNVPTIGCIAATPIFDSEHQRLDGITKIALTEVK
jgi:hypothetical protein